MESSRRDPLNGMAEYVPLLKNNQNVYHPRFGFSPTTGIVFAEISYFTNNSAWYTT